METITLELPSGAKLEFEVPPEQGMRKAGTSGKLASKAEEVLRSSLGATIELVGLIRQELDQCDHDGCDLQLGLSFTSGADAVIVRGEGTASLALTIHWSK